jgi:hypothetical protein
MQLQWLWYEPVVYLVTVKIAYKLSFNGYQCPGISFFFFSPFSLRWAIPLVPGVFIIFGGTPVQSATEPSLFPSLTPFGD